MKLTLGEQCLILRRRLGLNFTKAAQIANFSRSTVTLIEKSSKEIPIKTYMRYRDLLESRLSDER